MILSFKMGMNGGGGGGLQDVAGISNELTGLVYSKTRKAPLVYLFV